MKQLCRVFQFGFALAILACAGGAAAQAWPNQAIKLVVGSAAGGSADFVARCVADSLGRALGQPVIVENRPGAGGVVAHRAVANAKPDGNTLLLFYADSFTIAPQLTKTPPFDSLKDFTYVGAVARTKSFFLTVNPSVPAQTFEEFTKLMKSSQGKVSYATYGLGSFAHLSYAMMAAKVGADLVHVPYRNGVESQQAAIAGTVDSVAAINIAEFIKAGKLRPLALGGTKRSEDFPAVPTFSELGYGEFIFGPVVYGVAAPAGLAPEIVDRLAREVRKVADAPDFPQKLSSIATEPYWSGGAQVKEMVQKAMAAYAPIIEKLGLEKQ